MSCITLSCIPLLYVEPVQTCAAAAHYIRLASCTMLKLATNIKAMPSIYLYHRIRCAWVHWWYNVSAIFNLVDVKESQVANSAIFSMYPMHAVTIVGVTMHDCL